MKTGKTIMISTPLRRDYIREGKTNKKGWLEKLGKRGKHWEKSENTKRRSVSKEGRRRTTNGPKDQQAQAHEGQEAWQSLNIDRQTWIQSIEARKHTHA